MNWLYGLDRLHRVGSANARQALLRCAIDCGAAGFDVAPMYGNGMGELELGRFLQALGSKGREQIVVNTKFGIPFVPYGSLPHLLFKGCRVAELILKKALRRPEHRDFSKSALVRSVDESLSRLRTDYIDTLFIHEPLVSLVNPEEVQRALLDLRSAGKLRRFGVSGEHSCVFDIARQIEADVVQAPLLAWRKVSGLQAERGIYHIRRGLGKATSEGATLKDYVAAAQSIEGDYVLFQSTHLEHVKEFSGA